MFRWYQIPAAIFILTGLEAFNILDRMLYGEWFGKPGNKLTQGLLLLFIMSSFVLFARGRRRIRAFKTGVALVAVLVSLMACSVLWSIEPPTTIRYTFLYGVVVAGSIGLVTNFTADEFMKLFAWLCFLTAVASFALLAVAPGYAAMDTGGFRGIFSQKNILGEAMAMGVITALHGLESSKTGRWRYYVFIGVDTLGVIASESTTSLLTIFGCCSVYALMALSRKGPAGRSASIMACILLVPAMIFGLFFSDTLFELLGKDPTLTGRSVIWSYVINYIFQKPLFGWGYEGFWSVSSAPALEIADAIHWFSPQAHNGLLEILIHLGLVGAAIYISMLVRTAYLALQCLRTSERDRALGISSLLLCGAIVVGGVSETVLIHPFEASTSIFFAMGFFCERAVRASRLRRHAVPQRQVPRMTRFQVRQTPS